MKKIFTLLSLLFSLVGAANADESPITAIGDLSNSAAYTVQSARGYFVYNSADGLAWNSGHNDYTGTAVSDAATETFAQWGFYTSTKTGSTYMYNVASQTFLQNDGQNASLVATPTTRNFTLLSSTGSTASTYPTVIAFGSSQINMSTDTRYGLLTTWNDTGDEGNMLAITKVADISEDVQTAIAAKIEAIEVSYRLTSPDATKAYTISTAGRGSWCYVAAVSETNLTATCISGATDASDEAKEFAFITGANGLYIYSIAAKKFVSTGEGSQGYAGTALSVAPQTAKAELLTTDGEWDLYPNVIAIDGHHIGISDWYSAANGYTNIDGVISFWNDLTDAGNQVRIVEVEDASYDSAIPVARVALYEGIAAASVNIGTAYGTLAVNETYTTALEAANTALANADATAEELTTALTTLSEAYATLEYNVPEAGSFIRIKSYNSTNQYLGGDNYSDTENSLTRAAFITPTGEYDPATLFYYDGKYVINYKYGYYLTSPTTNGTQFPAYQGITTAVSGGLATIVDFKTQTAYTGTDGGKYNVTIYQGSRYLYARDDYSDAASSAGNDKAYTFDLEEVNALPLTISTVGYATLYAPCALSIPEGVTVYTATSFTGTKAYLDEVTTTEIPAGTPVVVKSNEELTEATTFLFPILKSTTATVGTNLLTGSYPALTVDADTKTYVLANKSKGVGFYRLSDHETDGDTKRDVYGFRAFYQPTEDAAANAFTFSFDGGLTGIDAIDAAAGINADAAIYDLSGRRVQKATKGLYIVNGKKVLVK